MNITDFTNLLADLFDTVDISTIKPDIQFRNLEGWDSFMALTIMAKIKSEYDVAVTAQEMRDAQTFQDLFNIVNTHLQ